MRIGSLISCSPWFVVVLVRPLGQPMRSRSPVGPDHPSDPHLKESKGLIVNVGSGTQFDPSETIHATYSAAKGAIANLTRSAAVEWGPDGIRAVLVLPAADVRSARRFPRPRPPEVRRDDGPGTARPLRRRRARHRPHIAWFATDEARFVTGSIIMLDGGQMQLR